MAVTTQQKPRLIRHVARLRNCRRCPLMHPPPVSGGAVVSEVLLVGQAPGVREPVVGKPFAWTAGKTLFRWFEEAAGLSEEVVRAEIYFAAVCRCFPGKAPGGSDRVPNPQEIANCSSWLNRELEILQPQLVIPVGKLAIAQFMAVEKLNQIIGQSFQVERAGESFDLIPLPHPSGASPWHRIAPGRDLLAKALQLIVRHKAFPKP
ncbi:MAG: uracil-DNA glycosylase family protein [Chthoniobacterales bacterium]